MEKNKLIGLTILGGALWAYTSRANAGYSQLPPGFIPDMHYDPLTEATFDINRALDEFGSYAAILLERPANPTYETPVDNTPWWTDQSGYDEWLNPDQWNNAGYEDDYGFGGGIPVSDLSYDTWSKTGDSGQYHPVIYQLPMGANWQVGEFPKYAQAIANAAASYGVPFDTLGRQLYAESAYRADVISGAKRSSQGAAGIAQFMPDTAAQYGLVGPNGEDYRLDPVRSINAAAKYDAALYNIFGNWQHAIAAYNWGPGNMRRFLRGDKNPRTGKPYAMPSETINYVASIFGGDTTTV